MKLLLLAALLCLLLSGSAAAPLEAAQVTRQHAILPDDLPSRPPFREVRRDGRSETVGVMASQGERLTFYGRGDGYLGRHPGAYWHGRLPAGWPAVVTESSHGVATSDLRAFPYGTVVRITIVGLPGFARQRQKLLGRSVTAVVTDWFPGPGWDAQPAVWQDLVGDWALGVVYVEVTMENDDGE